MHSSSHFGFLALLQLPAEQPPWFRASEGGVCGIYDNIEYWDAESSLPSEGGFDVDYFVVDLLAPGCTLAVIGTGGGKQLQVWLCFFKGAFTVICLQFLAVKSR